MTNPTIGKATGLEPADPHFAGRKRTIYNKETGEKKLLFSVDAREYLRSGKWTTSPKGLSEKLRKKTEQEAKDAEKKAVEDADRKAAGLEKPEADPLQEGKDWKEPEPSEPSKDAIAEAKPDSDAEEEEERKGPSWDDWNVKQLKAAAKEVKVEKYSSMGREDLIKSLEDSGVEPGDDRPEVD